MTDNLELTYDKLSLDRVNDLVKSNKCGAISIFVGTTRDNFDGKEVIKLEYEAYKPMALKCMKTLCEQVRQKYPSVVNIVIHHRLGVVPVEESSVIIGTSSVHRKEAIDATRTLIDELKQTVPIWKKEYYDENKSEWKENKELIQLRRGGKKSKHTRSFNDYNVKFKQTVHVPITPSHLVQIKADRDEIDRRIEKFMKRKRDEINTKNVREFCRRDLIAFDNVDDVEEPDDAFNRNVDNDDDQVTSCARIDSILLKRKDSKSHLQVNRVLNSYNRKDESTLMEMFMMNQPKNGIEERLINLEVDLNLTIDKPTPKNIYVRLKRLEDRLLYLESISPEYVCVLGKNNNDSANVNNKKLTKIKRRTFTINDIDNLISDLKKQKT